VGVSLVCAFPIVQSEGRAIFTRDGKEGRLDGDYGVE
jgi:hypothetical protein